MLLLTSKLTMTENKNQGTTIREFRLLIAHAGKHRKMCKLTFSNKDASIYIFPYARQGRFFFGSQAMEEQQLQQTFNFIEGAEFSEQMPKLSIHESGQIHIFMPSGKAGPLQIPPLASLRGHHVASVSVDAFEGLPEHKASISYTGSTQDHVIPTDDKIASGVIAIYINGERPAFHAPECRCVFTLNRPTLKQPLYVGIRPRAQKPLGLPERAGVTVIAGWDPTLTNNDSINYMYIRGE